MAKIGRTGFNKILGAGAIPCSTMILWSEFSLSKQIQVQSNWQ